VGLLRITLALALLLGAEAARAEAGTQAPQRAQRGEAERSIGQARLRAFLQHPAVAGARVGLLVEDLDTGDIVLAHNAGQGLVPASNQKLAIAAAALEQWGPSHQFETPVLASGTLRDGVLEGTLWIVGRGDPGLVSESLWRMAEELRLRGLREITDGIGIDASYFSGPAQHPDWYPLSRRAYHAPASAFAVNYSSFRIDVMPAPQVGALARLRVAPQVDYFQLRSDARTVPGRGRLQLGVELLADGSGERVTIAGSVGLADSTDTFWRCVALPERYAASLLRTQLEAHGIRVTGGIRLGAVPADAALLLRFEGEPLASLVWKLDKNSNNFIAEQLFRILGAEQLGPPATWEKGAQALGAWLGSAGLADRQTVVADGSGLSPRNRLAARTLVGLIRRGAHSVRSGPEFLASLPLGGLDGTLRDRELASLPVRAKTGHLRAVSSLAGVLPTRAGRRLAFAVVVNGARGPQPDVDAAIDALVLGLDQGVAAAND
jgi:D-alanyl-D-alanine carboxypeptidase/D-alanyl-D-alanine-endopeptidase (penicillin-binding protein 4)